MSSTPEPTQWHRKPRGLSEKTCPVCGYWGKGRGIHRAVTDEERASGAPWARGQWVRRMLIDGHWQMSAIGIPQPRRRSEESRESHAEKSGGSMDQNGHTPLSTYLRQFFAERGTVYTRHHHKSAVARLCRFLGHDIAVEDIDDDLVEQFAAWLAEEPLSATSKRLYRASIRTIARSANPDACLKFIDDDGLAVPGSLMRFFREVYRPQRMTGATDGAVGQVRFVISRFAKYLGRPPLLSDLTDETVSGFMQSILDSGLSRVTANHSRGYVLALWRYAYRVYKKQTGRKRLVREAPDVPKLREHRRLPVAWTIEQMQRLLTAAAETGGSIDSIPAGLWWTALLLTMYDTGIRRGAAFAIQRCDVDLDTGWLTVPAENQKQKVEQRFKVSGQTSDALRRIWEPPRRLLFPWPSQKTNAAWTKLTGILIRAELPHGPRDKYHKIRRTTASHIAKAAGVSVASAVLGHSDVEVTKRYIDPTIAGSSVNATAYLPRLNFAAGNGRK